MKYPPHAVWRLIDNHPTLVLYTLGGAFSLVAFVSAGVVLGVIWDRLSLVYVLSFFGFASLVFFLGVGLHEMRTMPRRVGYESEHLLTEQRGGEAINRIAFEEIQALHFGKFSNGWLIIVDKKDGEHIRLGPVRDGRFGEQMVRTYESWLQSSGLLGRAEERRDWLPPWYLISVERRQT